MDCIGYFRISPIDNTRIHVSVGATLGKHGTVKQSPVDNSILVPLQPQQVLTIGRSRTNNVHINNPTVSTSHAVIWSVQFEEGSTPVVYVHDQSRNGIIHNGVEMGNGHTALLNDADTVEIQTAATIMVRCFKEENVSQGEISRPLEDWEITNKLIGTGSFGSVFVAKKTGSSKLFAVKIIQNSHSSYFREHEVTINESRLLSKIQHPNIIRVYDTIVRDSNIFIFQNLVCGGDLFSYLVCDGYLKGIPEKEAILMVFQLMKALQFLHRKLQIIHRDIKLDNILLELPLPHSKIYLCDFGIAKHIGYKRTKTCVGTLEYSAPEVFKYDSSGKKTLTPYDFRSDMWSLGVVTHILLSGISPFYSDNRDSIIDATRVGKLNFEKPQFHKVSQAAKSFVKRLLQLDPENRMDVEECFEHVWIKLNRPKLEKFYREKIE
ncbi:Meiosis-specific serine/threonine-protein kinase MEK1 [Candida viswanathii]|uniref:Meiosis-specific serine/threonine-protein kinase MEK1 n=1 Tax=Candida viswanathii TaxID=5486 RepID=A0A367XP08_9ASCO|nr:Meiosis-specific serine/threonine-protein kinase MEK1 [Candida viswanathii]